MNFREKGGYTLTKVPFTPQQEYDRNIQVLLYIAIEGNANYVGEETLEEIALRISKSVGPSGPNVEYLYNVAAFLEDNNIVNEDDRQHTIRLRDHVKSILINNKEIK